MKKNIGKKDRIIRLIIGSLLIISSVFLKSPVLAIFGLFTIYESIVSWCIFYQLIGRNTCPLSENDKTGDVKIKHYYLIGLTILFTAIVLNLFAGYLGWSTWYDVISSLKQYGVTDSLANISLDNWLFLIIIYPLSLAYLGIFVYKKFQD